MTFKVSQQQVKELAEIETEAGCDIEAGFDWGQRAGNYIASTGRYIDRKKLIFMLRDELGELLNLEDIESIATELEARSEALIAEKLHSKKSA